MSTSSEIKQRANALAEKTDVNSITPKEVGSIMYDLASHSENVLRNGGTLGIRKVYESVAAMEADSTNPIDIWGNPIKKGNLVVIYDGTTTGVDNNKIYAFMNPGWQIATHLDAGYATKAETDAKLAELASLGNSINENRYGYNATVNGMKGGVHTIESAINDVPAKHRMLGQKITFRTENGDWATYHNESLSLDNYENVNDWVQEVGISSVTGDINITNAPDYEDLTEAKDGTIKFADKEYNKDSFSGLGRVYLRKNIVDGMNVLTQDMMSKSNTVYIIQYDYNLQGVEITVPKGCVIDFQGGSFSNGIVVGGNTIIRADLYKVFDRVELNGTFCAENLHDVWFDNLTSDIIESFDCLRVVLANDVNNELVIRKKVELTSHAKTINLHHSIIVDASNVVINNINIESYAQAAIKCSNETNIPMTNIIVENSTITNHHTDRPVGVQILGNVCCTIIQNCEFKNFIGEEGNNGWAVHYTWRRDYALDDFNNYIPILNRISNCKAYNCYSGFSFSGGYGNNIDNCIVEDAIQGFFLFDGHFGNMDNFHVISSIKNCIAKNVKSAVDLQGSDFSSSPTVHNVNYVIDNISAYSSGDGTAITVIGPFEGRIDVKNSNFKDFERVIRLTTYFQIRDENKQKGALIIENNDISGCTSEAIDTYISLNCLRVENNRFNNLSKTSDIKIQGNHKYIYIDFNTFKSNTINTPACFIDFANPTDGIDLRKACTYMSLSHNNFDGFVRSMPVRFNTGLPTYMQGLVDNSSPYNPLYTSSIQKSFINSGKNRIEFSYSPGDISIGSKSSGDIVISNNDQYIFGYKYNGGSSYHTLTAWEADLMVLDGQLIYCSINGTEYVFLVNGDGKLGSTEPTNTELKTSETNGSVNLINLGKRYSVGDTTLVHTELSCLLKDLPQSGVPNGFKAYVSDRKFIAVHYSGVWYDTRTSFKVTEPRGGSNRPQLSDSDVGAMFLDQSAVPNKPIWYIGGGKWIDATGAEV